MASKILFNFHVWHFITHITAFIFHFHLLYNGFVGVNLLKCEWRIRRFVVVSSQSRLLNAR